MKIFMAGLAAETNTFSPIFTTESGFKDEVWFRNDASRHPAQLGTDTVITWRQRGEADDHEIVESVFTYAQAGGLTLQPVYEGFRDTILGDLRAAAPVDIVLLFMHGAMVADGYDDCEGDMLTRVREIVGPDVTVGIELDLHCHLTEAMRTYADLIITFKEYPHTDMAARAHELYDLCVAAAENKIKPVIAYHDCRMTSIWRTTFEPVKSFVARMRSLEGKNGILSVSFGHGFNWGDVAEGGAKIVVVADGDMAKAQALARQLGDEIWRMRHETLLVSDTVDQGIDAATADDGTGKPLVLADQADNAGGGAPSDNTSILRRLVDRRVTGAVIGCFWDPVATSFCMDAGVGTTFMLRIGGKCGQSSGDPVDLMVTVRGLSRNHVAPGLPGSVSAYGDTAWVHSAGIDIVVNSRRNQVFAPEVFTNLGLLLQDKRVIVVKSTQHFYTAFEPVARAIRFVSAPGALQPDFTVIPYRKRKAPFWPRVDNPFVTDMI